jgi:hypothetical protein
VAEALRVQGVEFGIAERTAPRVPDHRATVRGRAAWARSVFPAAR